MSFVPRTKEDPKLLRRQLLIELSVLRQRYAQLADDVEGDKGAVAFAGARRHGDVAASFSGSGASVSDGDDNDDSGQLCQSDRDAIEALFHSVDDFTREFNEGKGGLEREDIFSRIMQGST